MFAVGAIMAELYLGVGRPLTLPRKLGAGSVDSNSNYSRHATTFRVARGTLIGTTERHFFSAGSEHFEAVIQISK